MANIENIVPFIKKWEGGFVCDPDDAGGATMSGITYATFCAWRKRKGMPKPTIGALKNISHTEWMEILKKLYWDKVRADEIVNTKVAILLVDWVWGSGTGIIKKVQHILGVKEDGIFGPISLCTLNSKNQAYLYDDIEEAREIYFRAICASRPKNAKFLRGWLNRLHDIRTYTAKML